MTQLYSNLVTYINNTTYLCLVLAVLCSLVVFRVRLALLHMASPLPTYSSIINVMSSLASIPHLWIKDNKGGPTHGHKTKSLFCSTEVRTSCFTFFG